MKKDNRQNLTTKIAYIAGFIDGEGCIRIKRANSGGNSYYVTLQVTNTDKSPLVLIQNIFGGKVYFQEKGTNKIVWQYYSTCNEAIDTLRTLEGFLVCKKEQAKLAIYFHDNKGILDNNDKKTIYQKMRDMKIIGNIYENPGLLDG